MSNKVGRVLNEKVQNIKKGSDYFKFARKNASSGLYNKKKVALRIITNLKKYAGRVERRKINQQLNFSVCN